MSTLKAPCPWIDAGPRGKGLALDDYPSAMLMRLANQIHTDITSVYARDHALTVPEYRLLTRLDASAPMQLAALCRSSAFDKAYAGRVLRALEDRALVATRIDEAHKRRVVVDITPAGRALCRQIQPVARRRQMELLQVLQPAEREALYASLRKLMASVGLPDLTAPT